MAVTLVVPTADSGTQDWTPTGAATTYETIDETIASANDTDYVETTGIGDVVRVALGDTPANTNEVTAVGVNVRGVITDVATTAKIECRLYHSGNPGTLIGTMQTLDGTAFGGYGTLGTATALDWTGLTLTKVQADGLEVSFTFVAS